MTDARHLFFDMPTEPTEGPCHFCQKPCTDDSYCFGCKKFVCSGCERNGGMMGAHTVDDHRRSGEDEDDYDEDLDES